MPDLIYLLNSLTNSSGKILVPGIYDDVLPESSDEISLYENINFSVKSFKEAVGCEKIIHENKVCNDTLYF